MHGKIVWEWHLSDHLIQDFDAKKSNYGKPGDHPELLDFNMGVLYLPLLQTTAWIFCKQRDGPTGTRLQVTGAPNIFLLMQ